MVFGNSDHTKVYFDDYSMEVDEYGDLLVNGCDCSALVDLEEAREMLELIGKWVKDQEKKGG